MGRTDTRNRLVSAAKEVIHRQGFRDTTLAEIAAAADVPLGNVYYHFRTKESLAEAVIERHAEELRATFARLEGEADPRERLKQLVRGGAAIGEQLVEYGCPYGSLCQELEKGDKRLAEPAERLFRMYLDWSAQQFRLLGQEQEAEDLAGDLVAALQGTYLLANSFHSCELLDHRLERLVRWLDTI
jgi:AcrR family transcriptional regulator